MFIFNRHDNNNNNSNNTNDQQYIDQFNLIDACDESRMQLISTKNHL